MKLLNVADYRRSACARLPRGLFEYVDRGTEDEVALHSLRKALNDTKIKQFVLNNVSAPDTSVTVFGKRLPAPLIISPTAVAGLLWYDGEVALARAARTAGIPFTVATQSMTSLEEIASRAPGTVLWFQLYVFEDRSLSNQLMQRASSIGIDTLLVTVDTARSPKKEWNTRNGFGIPIVPSFVGGIDLLKHPRWTCSVLLRYLMSIGVPTYAHYPPEYRTKITREVIADNVKLARRLTWDDVKEIRKQWRGTLVLKGILSAEDAEQAHRLGADGIIVSSHGGRNFDSGSAAIEVLPEVADAVGHKLTILADSGIRRGSDIVKYIASGAKAVLLGRATLYGVGANGEHGAAHVIQILREELDHCLAFAGQPTLSSIDRSIIKRP